MYDTVLYVENNRGLNDAEYILKTYGHNLKWRSDKQETIADLGCADGTIINNALLPLYGDNTKTVVGFDMSKKVIELANNGNEHSNVTYVVFDISREIGENLWHKFDHIFSFRCLHFMRNQSICATNLFKMLRPGGEILVTIVFGSPVLKAVVALSKDPKWSKYTGNFYNHFANYYNCKSPIDEFKRVYEEAGFVIELCTIETVKNTYEVSDFRNMALSVNSLVKVVPEDRREEFISDFNAMLDTETKLVDTYIDITDLLVALARKPLKS